MSTTSPRERILVVEDEPSIRQGLVDLLGVHGYDAVSAADGASASKLVASPDIALIILDLMIPPPTGMQLLATLRRDGVRTPVLVLTAKGSEEDIVEGLENGADDYVTKPFGVRELVARVRGLIRRKATMLESGDSTGTRDASTTAPPARFDVGGNTIDTENLCVRTRDGARIELTVRESALLQFLFANRHRIATRAELLVHVWGYRDGNIETRTVDVHVQKLRAKLKQLGDEREWIETARGLGYRLATP